MGADINCNFVFLVYLCLCTPRGLETMLTVRHPISGVLVTNNCCINPYNVKEWRGPSLYSLGNWSPRKSSDLSKIMQLVGERGFTLELLDSGSVHHLPLLKHNGEDPFCHKLRGDFGSRIDFHSIFPSFFMSILFHRINTLGKIFLW